jgi:hypothetical protein
MFYLITYQINTPMGIFNVKKRQRGMDSIDAKRKFKRYHGHEAIRVVSCVAET